MQLTVRDVSRLLKVSEKTVYRWIGQGKLPAYRVGEQFRFNRSELLEWATSQRINPSPELFAEPESSAAPPMALGPALREGGVYYRLSGNDRFTALRALVEVMRLPESVDREFLYRVLLAREALQSTGVGDGVALPHPRGPIVLHTDRPMVTLGFLERAVDFAALDGRPVHALFSVVSPTTRAHLQVLSRIAHALRDPEFKQLIADEGGRDAILAAADRVDREMAERATLDGAGAT